LERFVPYSNKKFAPDNYIIKGQVKKAFWESELKTKVGMEPDIVIHHDDKTFILDTKWKVLNGTRPADADIKQMYVYTKYFDSKFTALVYPDDLIISTKGSFLHEQNEEIVYPCSLIKLQLPLNTTNLINWQEEICTSLLSHIGS